MSEPILVSHSEMLLARFAIEEHTGDDRRWYEVYAYGAIARECVKNLRREQDVTIEGRLIQRLHEANDHGAPIGDALIVSRVWLNHLKLLVA